MFFFFFFMRMRRVIKHTTGILGLPGARTRETKVCADKMGHGRVLILLYERHFFNTHFLMCTSGTGTRHGRLYDVCRLYTNGLPNNIYFRRVCTLLLGDSTRFRHCLSNFHTPGWSLEKFHSCRAERKTVRILFCVFLLDVRALFSCKHF